MDDFEISLIDLLKAKWESAADTQKKKYVAISGICVGVALIGVSFIIATIKNKK